jgi:hypothetical protein
MRRHTFWLVLAGLAAAHIASSVAAAQGVVVRGASSAQYIELQPLVLDSVRYAATDSAWGIYRRTSSGILARCDALNNFCSYFRSAGRNSLVAMTQDLDVTAWGFGEGISVHAQLRARAAAGDARELWPQATQRFDAIDAYIELERAAFRARAGRQWVTSSLGVFNFDGASLLLRPSSALTAELYGGGTLVQGLNRALDANALAPIEDLPPVDGAYVLGATAQFRPSPLGGVRLQYQREIRRDRGVLYSERFGANAEMRTGRAMWSGELTRDLAQGQFNDLSLAFRRTLPLSTAVRVEVRRYVPYFDLWTIWGAFSPVGYSEARGTLDWAPAGSRVALGVSGGRRSYDDTETGVAFLPLRTDGWRVGGTASLRAAERWTLNGSYNMDINFGASSSDEDLALRWTPSDALTLGLRGLAFQNIYEFQIGTGRVVGGGGEIGWRLFPDVRLVADALLYRHTGNNAPQQVDWNQRRGTFRLEWTLGGANPVRIR